MAPRNREQNEQMRAESMEKITKAGLTVFAKYGYHGATLKKITQATGLSYGLVYHYFPSKDKIFFHLVDLALKTSKNLIDRAFSTPGSAWDKIRALSALQVKEGFSGDVPCYFLIVHQAMAQATELPGLAQFIGTRLSHYARFDDLIIQAQKDGDVIEGDPGTLGAAYLSLVQGLAFFILQNEEDIQSKITPDILDNLLRKRAP